MEVILNQIVLCLFVYDSESGNNHNIQQEQIDLKNYGASMY